MAVQLAFEEVTNCQTYFEWLCSKAFGEATDKSYTRMMRFLFSNDFRVKENAEKDILADEIRATDAMELRHRYANEVGTKADKSERDIDRIWKSVHGKCSVLEFILQIAIRLDEMINEDEPDSMVGLFFGIMLKNLGIDNADSDEDLKTKIDRFLDRSYCTDGTKGGLFPLKKCSKDQRQVAVWDQMSAWLNEHLDEDAQFKRDDF